VLFILSRQLECCQRGFTVKSFSFNSVLAAKRFCTTKNLGCYSPLIVAKDGVFFVFLLGEPVGEFDHTSKFIRWGAGSYQLAARFQTLTGKWEAY
jgi:hypothetical protein